MPHRLLIPQTANVLPLSSVVPRHVLYFAKWIVRPWELFVKWELYRLEPWCYEKDEKETVESMAFIVILNIDIKEVKAKNLDVTYEFDPSLDSSSELV